MSHTEGMSIDEVVGTKVHMAMFRQRQTQTRLSARMGMTQSALSKKIHGERPWTVEELAQAAFILDVPLAELIPTPEELPHLDSNQKPFDYESEDDDDYPFRGDLRLAA